MTSLSRNAFTIESISPPTVSRDEALRGHGFLAAWFSTAYFLGLAMVSLGLLKLFPSSVSCLYGAFLLCIAPGFALFSVMSIFQEHRYSAFTIFLMSISMGFTYNFTINVLVFVFTLSIDQALILHLSVGFLLYAFLARYWLHHGITRFSPHFTAWRVKVCIGLALILLLVLPLSLRYPPMQFIEELIVLRKLVTNDFIFWDNISIGSSELTTYLFVPFYLFISLVSRVAGIDVFTTLPLLWPFTAFISMLCMAHVSQLLSHRWHGACFLILLCLGYALLFAIPRPDAFTGPNPFPDRYAVSSWLLVPLALFHFLIHIGHKQINLPTFIGLVYLLVEMTFIHARETLFSLVFVFTVCFVLALDFKAHRHHLMRIFWLLVLVVICLATYKTVNTRLNPDLGQFIASHKSQLINEFKTLWESHGWTALFRQPPSYPLFNYPHHLYLIIEEGGYVFYPFALLLLPFYAWRADRLSQLFAPVGICLFGLYSICGGLRLLVSIPVGVPFVMEAATIESVLMLLVLSDLLRLFARALFCPGNGRLVVLLVFVTAGFVGWKAAVALHQNLADAAWKWVWVETGSYLFTLGAVVVRARRFANADADVSTDPPGRTWAIYTAVCAASIALLWMNPALRGKAAYPDTYFRQVIGEDRVDSTMSLGVSMPLNLYFEPTRSGVSFIAAQAAKRTVWIGSDTLAPLLVSNQTTPLLTSRGEIIYSYEPNVFFMRKYDPEYRDGRHKRFMDFLTALPPDTLLDLLERERIGMITLFLDDIPAFQRSIEPLAGGPVTITPVFRDSRYAFYRVTGSRDLPADDASKVAKP